MTPSYYNAGYINPSMYYVTRNGVLSRWTDMISYFAVRPVINIRSDALISQGDGAIENPFILELA